MQQSEDIDIDELNEPTQLQIPIKYLSRAIFYTIIVSFSTLYFGYSITLISATSLTLLINYYQITMSRTVTTALLNGILPLGAILGALLTSRITPLATRRRIHYYLAIVTIVVCGISVIPTVQTVLIGRFLLGGITSLYLSVSAGYIRQNFPAFMRKYLGAIYACGRVLGILVCYMIATLSNFAQDDTEHIFVFFGPAYISVIQAILVKFYLPDSVIELLRKNRNEDACESLSMIYAPENVQRRLKQILEEINQSTRQTAIFQSKVFLNPKNLTSLHLGVLRHFCGMGYIIVYAGQVVARFNTYDPKFVPTVVNSVQLASNIIGIFLVQKFSRTTLLLISCWLMGAINLVIGVADIESNVQLCIAMMCIFMIPCGAGLNSIVYAFPSQLVPPNQGRYTSAISWLASAIVSVVPPFVVQALPNSLAYPMFFFFGTYLAVISFINLRLLPEAEPPSKRKVHALKEMMM